MPLVIYGLGGGHTRMRACTHTRTHTHTHTHTHMHIRLKVILRNQATSRCVPDLKCARREL